MTRLTVPSFLFLVLSFQFLFSTPSTSPTPDTQSPEILSREELLRRAEQVSEKSARQRMNSLEIMRSTLEEQRSLMRDNNAELEKRMENLRKIIKSKLENSNAERKSARQRINSFKIIRSKLEEQHSVMKEMRDNNAELEKRMEDLRKIIKSKLENSTAAK